MAVLRETGRLAVRALGTLRACTWDSQIVDPGRIANHHRPEIVAVRRREHLRRCPIANAPRRGTLGGRRAEARRADDDERLGLLLQGAGDGRGDDAAEGEAGQRDPLVLRERPEPVQHGAGDGPRRRGTASGGVLESRRLAEARKIGHVERAVPREGRDHGRSSAARSRARHAAGRAGRPGRTRATPSRRGRTASRAGRPAFSIAAITASGGCPARASNISAACSSAFSTITSSVARPPSHVLSRTPSVVCGAGPPASERWCEGRRVAACRPDLSGASGVRRTCLRSVLHPIVFYRVPCLWSPHVPREALAGGSARHGRPEAASSCAR